MTNERALEEFKFAVNQWFRHMDRETREKAIVCAHHALQLPIGQVLHQALPFDRAVSSPIRENGLSQQVSVAGRGAHLRAYAGKVWMLNRSTMERARVEPNEVAAYEAKGFIKRGARGN